MKRHGPSPDAKEIDDLCLCERGRLKEGQIEPKIRVKNILQVIKNVQARVCSLCDEAYISPETSQQIEEIIANIALEGWQQSLSGDLFHQRERRIKPSTHNHNRPLLDP
jgi:YgiT-type zinc finger domain-containing protein